MRRRHAARPHQQPEIYFTGAGKINNNLQGLGQKPSKKCDIKYFIGYD
jgi:hypothetical protein